ncbi:hypothetical protein JQC67_16535 [Aurantibacter crassamenti]|uniref:hypothetical protein n=1 Tax=Aurantibacter crassamenti TaxID=1837375 RepID=UPI00193AAA30|nr:hypothetical protein [Aurantibacter crassamenti]MBM1107765.1 hypothetical protein [Aurantibacter crassamenti]
MNIDELVDETLESVSKIDKVKAPPFFKDKVLNRMAQQTEKSNEGIHYLDWFTPKYQAAALICFVLLNTAVLLSNTDDSYSENVSDFADVYGITKSDSDTYLY